MRARIRRICFRALIPAGSACCASCSRRGDEFAEASALVDRQIDVMRQHGASIVEDLTTGGNLIERFPNLRVNDFELRVTHDAYLARRGPASPVKTLSELVASGKFLKSLEPRLRQALTVGPLDTNAEYLSRLEARASIRQSLIDLMDRASVEALVYPFKSLGAPLIGDGDRLTRDNPLSSVTGLPAIVLPAGDDAGRTADRNRDAGASVQRTGADPRRVGLRECHPCARGAVQHAAFARRDVCLLGPVRRGQLQSRILWRL
jgi:Asp-tRNA(Asn)/Glu-tRNA(Gln) amidotransferase A subunit family amidase